MPTPLQETLPQIERSPARASLFNCYAQGNQTAG